MTSSIEQVIEDFALLEQWEDRYRYLIDMGSQLKPLAANEQVAANKVSGCVSQVWLVKDKDSTTNQLLFRGTSDAAIVRGLIALLLLLYSGKGKEEILATDALALFAQLGLAAHITPQRSNGFAAMVSRLRQLTQETN